MSDDLTFRFGQKNWSEWPLTADKFVNWLKNIDPKQEVVNVFIDYQTFGEHQKAETGIFQFLETLPALVLKETDFIFSTPSELAKELQPVSAIKSQEMVSWADEERDLTAWMGNEMQKEALAKLYAHEPAISRCTDADLLRDWYYLQASDHFYYMSTKWFSAGEIHNQYNPYASPYDAFINFMNVLADFSIRLEQHLAGKPSITAPPEAVSEKTPVSPIKAKTGKAAPKTKSKPARTTKK